MSSKKKPGNRSNDKKDDFKKEKRSKAAHSSNRRNRTDSEMVDRPKPATTNDPDFWMGLGQYSMDVSRISTMQPIGSKLPSPVMLHDYWTPAGVMRIDYIPYFGEVSSPVDALNVAAKKLYDEINSKNSRNPSYDPSDLMIYVIAVANAWALHSFVKRIVGMYNTFIPLNKYWWQQVMLSMGIAPISTNEDIIKWRNLLNRMAIKLNNLIVPSNIPYFKRAYMMSEFVYADAPLAKASLFYYSPAALMQYTYDEDDQTGKLVNRTTPWFSNAGKVTPAQVEDYFNALTSSLFNDSDINTMSADIMKAYGLENCFHLPLVDESYSILPFYDELMSMELHNGRICYAMYDQVLNDHAYTIKQDMMSNSLAADGRVIINKSYGDAPILYGNATGKTAIPLDFWKDNPIEKEVMEATRLCYNSSSYLNHSTDPDDPGDYDTVVVSGCCELLIMDTIYEFEWKADKWSFEQESGCTYIVCFSNKMVSSLDKISKISKFSCAPISYVMQSFEGQTMIPNAHEIICDTTNFTVIDSVTLQNMHDAATLSIFLPRH